MAKKTKEKKKARKRAKKEKANGVAKSGDWGKKALHAPDGKFLPGPRPKGFTPGRPKGSYSLTRLLRNILKEKSEDGTTRGQQVMEVLIQKCEEGKIDAVKEVLQRIDGKVPDVVVTDASFLREIDDAALDKMIAEKGPENE